MGKLFMNAAGLDLNDNAFAGVIRGAFHHNFRPRRVDADLSFIDDHFAVHRNATGKVEMP